jgi:hypothetical protein
VILFFHVFRWYAFENQDEFRPVAMKVATGFPVNGGVEKTLGPPSKASVPGTF